MGVAAGDFAGAGFTDTGSSNFNSESKSKTATSLRSAISNITEGTASTDTILVIQKLRYSAISSSYLL